MHIGLRFTVMTPLAALATVGLFLGMKALIVGDFKPQDKLAAAQFEINPKVEDIEPPKRVIKVAALKDIEIPPQLPVINRVSAVKPSEPIVATGRDIPDFKPIDLTFNPVGFVESDADAKPLVRIAAVMPPRAERSGHCDVRFDVTAEGTTFNIQTTSCSQRLFERPTIRAVSKWKYKPKIRGGVPVARSGVKSTMSFNLTDERGKIITE